MHVAAASSSSLLVAQGSIGADAFGLRVCLALLICVPFCSRLIQAQNIQPQRAKKMRTSPHSVREYPGEAKHLYHSKSTP